METSLELLNKAKNTISVLLSLIENTILYDMDEEDERIYHAAVLIRNEIAIELNPPKKKKPTLIIAPSHVVFCNYIRYTLGKETTENYIQVSCLEQIRGYSNMDVEEAIVLYGYAYEYSQFEMIIKSLKYRNVPIKAG